MSHPELTQSVALFLVPIAVGITTEIIKFVNYIRKHGWHNDYSIVDGHMPSAHTAYITSLVTIVYLFEGYRSSSFAVALVMAIIVITDALRLRAHVGRQAETINRIVNTLSLNTNDFPHLKERVGHRPAEVAVGAVCGALLTVVFFAIFLA
jgi:acid phosphatase family membrane protein YuiD